LGSIYKCPVCGLPLARAEKQYICPRRHCFDISDKNYVNLLLANQKKTSDPGDNRDMMENRRNFLNKGYYLRFSQGLNEAVTGYLPHDAKYILDSGCGEGYFISMLKNRLSNEENRGQIDFYGIDISKSAIKYAARRDRSINFAVASSFELPILDNSLDCVIRNFSPGHPREFSRVLKSNGILVVVTPGVEHLYELKERLYEKPRKNEIKDSTMDGFEIIENKQIEYAIHLKDNEEVRKLVTMTPYYWTIAGERRDKLNEMEGFSLTLQFNIHIYKKQRSG
jgi:23S rRNA (guanine745-N1)-methyltransferase